MSVSAGRFDRALLLPAAARQPLRGTPTPTAPRNGEGASARGGPLHGLQEEAQAGAERPLVDGEPWMVVRKVGLQLAAARTDEGEGRGGDAAVVGEVLSSPGRRHGAQGPSADDGSGRGTEKARQALVIHDHRVAAPVDQVCGRTMCPGEEFHETSQLMFD